MESLPDIKVVLADLAARGIVLPAGRVFLDEFGDSPELSIELLGLIRAGGKRAGARLLWGHEHDGEPVPSVGDLGIVLDHQHRVAFVTRVTRVEVVTFDDVTAEYAMLEGEGDGSLEHWRRGHWAFFSRECVQIGRVPTLSMPVVCAVFEVLYEL